MLSTKQMLLVSIPACTLLLMRRFGAPLLGLAALGIFAGVLSAHLLIVFVYWCILYPNYVSPLRNLPLPTGSSILSGHLSAMLKKPHGISWRVWANDVPNDGLIRCKGVLNEDRLMVLSPAAVAEVLVHRCYDFEKPAPFKVSSITVLGDGILFAEGDVHKQQRKTLMPAFSFRHIKGLSPMFWNRSRRMVRAIRVQGERFGEDDSVVIEVCSWASKATLSIIEEAALGVDLESIENDKEPLNLTYHTILGPGMTNKIVSFLAVFLPSWFIWNLPLKLNRAIKKNATILSDICQEQSQRAAKSEPGQDGLLPTNTILSTMVNSKQFSPIDLVEQMKTFIIAGHETTATGLTWAVYLLTQHPEMQTRLREEVSSLPGGDDDGISTADIDGLVYLHAFISEVLRLYPPVPGTIREAARDTSILGTAVPKGTIIMLIPWAVNTNKNYWGDDAEEFKPDRWLKSPGGGADSNYALLTFLHGPRSCIGERFARSEFACLLAAWVRAFETELEKPEKEMEIDMTTGITVKPKGGLRVRLKPIQ